MAVCPSLAASAASSPSPPKPLPSVPSVPAAHEPRRRFRLTVSDEFAAPVDIGPSCDHLSAPPPLPPSPLNNSAERSSPSPRLSRFHITVDDDAIQPASESFGSAFTRLSDITTAPSSGITVAAPNAQSRSRGTRSKASRKAPANDPSPDATGKWVTVRGRKYYVVGRKRYKGSEAYKQWQQRTGAAGSDTSPTPPRAPRVRKPRAPRAPRKPRVRAATTRSSSAVKQERPARSSKAIADVGRWSTVVDDSFVLPVWDT